MNIQNWKSILIDALVKYYKLTNKAQGSYEFYGTQILSLN